MYIHLGWDTVACSKDVVGIFDLDNTTRSKHTLSFLSAAEKSGDVVMVGEDLPKSFVLCAQGSAASVFLTQLSSATLTARATRPVSALSQEL